MVSNFAVRSAAKIGGFLCKYRGIPISDALESAIAAFDRRLNNVDFDMRNNGELRVLRMLGLINPRMMFDVGANKGDWSLLASRMYPSCKIHAFEIVPSTYQELVTNTRQFSNIVPNNMGLSDQTGTLTISIGGDDTSTATACAIQGMKFHEEYYTREIPCSVTKASEYLKGKGIEQIDFLKIDVEGMDLKVIRGFEDTIGLVRALQFEYGIFNIASHDLLSDFSRYLNGKGFVVGKIFPRHVEFFEYHFDRENFHGSNYLAVRREETALIESLARRSP